jgi:hypothetical protein
MTVGSEKQDQEGSVEMVWAAADRRGTPILNLRLKVHALRKERK